MRLIDRRTGKEETLIFDAELNAALDSVEAHFSCDHETTEVREFRASNGSAHFKHQCMRCGARIGSALKRVLGGEPVPLEDSDLRESWIAQNHSARADAMQAHLERQLSRKTQFWDEYKEYMASDAWGVRRKLVLRRAAYICEGCGMRSATQVHHLSYAHFKEEFLFELVALCQPCHERAHADHDEEDDRGDIEEEIDF